MNLNCEFGCDRADYVCLCKWPLPVLCSDHVANHCAKPPTGRPHLSKPISYHDLIPSEADFPRVTNLIEKSEGMKLGLANGIREEVLRVESDANKAYMEIEERLPQFHQEYLSEIRTATGKHEQAVATAAEEMEKMIIRPEYRSTDKLALACWGEMETLAGEPLLPPDEIQEFIDKMSERYQKVDQALYRTPGETVSSDLEKLKTVLIEKQRDENRLLANQTVLRNSIAETQLALEATRREVELVQRNILAVRKNILKTNEEVGRLNKDYSAIQHKKFPNFWTHFCEGELRLEAMNCLLYTCCYPILGWMQSKFAGSLGVTSFVKMEMCLLPTLCCCFGAAVNRFRIAALNGLVKHVSFSSGLLYCLCLCNYCLIQQEKYLSRDLAELATNS